MQIVTHYNKNENVFTIHRGAIREGKVKSIAVAVTDRVSILYHVIFETVDAGAGEFPESALFATKDALIESLKE